MPTGMEIKRYQVEAINKRRINETEFFEIIQTAHQLGTKITIKLQAKESLPVKDVLKAAFDRIHEIELMMSARRSDSILTQINATGKSKGYEIPAELGMIISKAGEYSRLTGGAFDISVGPILNLYRIAAQTKTSPSEQEIADTKQLVDYRNISLSEDLQSLTLANDSMALDLGAIAKGYAIDEAIAILGEHGVEHALIEAGGDIRVIGKRADGKKWSAGIQDPKGESGECIHILEISGRSVCTSGNYARGYWLGEKRVSHIVDPRTGKPCDQNPSVTVIAPDAITADVLATALSVLGRKGLEIIEKLEGVESFVLTVENGSLSHYSSSGFKQFLRD